MLDFVFIFIFKYTFGITGAFILWFIEGRKKNIHAYFKVEDYGGIAYALGFLIISIAVIVVLFYVGIR